VERYFRLAQFTKPRLDTRAGGPIRHNLTTPLLTAFSHRCSNMVIVPIEEHTGLSRVSA
jgi:hypothetical protein